MDEMSVVGRQMSVGVAERISVGCGVLEKADDSVIYKLQVRFLRI